MVPHIILPHRRQTIGRAVQSVVLIQSCDGQIVMPNLLVAIDERWAMSFVDVDEQRVE